MATSNPTTYRRLIYAESRGGLLLPLKVLNQVSENVVHQMPSNGYSHMLGHGYTYLQDYGATHNIKRMDYSARLKAARKHAGLTQAELAKRLGINQTSISDLERGKSASSSHTTSIAVECGVSPYWLESGKGEMTAATAVRELETVYQTGSYKEYPLISAVQAGAWHEVIDEFQPGDAEEWHGTTKNAGPAGFWLKVRGDSMTSPAGKSFPEGMLILVNPDLGVEPGHYVVAKLVDTQEATFKQLVEDAGAKFLKPLNPAWPMIPINGNCRIVGRVVEAKWADL